MAGDPITERAAELLREYGYGQPKSDFEQGSEFLEGWMAAVRRCTAIDAARRLVIQHIGATAAPDGSGAWKSNWDVARDLRLSEDTARRARKDAARLGFWVEIRPARGHLTGVIPVEYQLTMPPAVS